MHLVLKSKKNLYKSQALIEAQVARQSEIAGLRVYDIAVAVDHVHLLLKIPSRRDYVKFIRALSGILARKVGKGLWSLAPFSRVAHWGKAFQVLRRYFLQNREEAAGRRIYQPRRNWYESQLRAL